MKLTAARKVATEFNGTACSFLVSLDQRMQRWQRTGFICREFNGKQVRFGRNEILVFSGIPQRYSASSMDFKCT
jgi:hypothetical protein